jgi:hypothetical protein
MLNCHECPLLVEIPITLVKLRQLRCGLCILLKSIPKTLVNLSILSCYGCPLLIDIPDSFVRLIALDCINCSRLAVIPATLVNLRELFCIGCHLLSRIPQNDLFVLECSHCPLLTTVPRATILRASHCTWLDKKNQAAFVQVKTKLMRYFYFKRWIKTREFQEWFYHPDNFGGYKHKLQLQASLAPRGFRKRKRKRSTSPDG